MMWFLVVVVAVVAVVALGIIQSNRRRDGVASFRRQIDALSPEARRPVVDQVQSAAERRHDQPADDQGDDEGDDEDGPRGA